MIPQSSSSHQLLSLAMITASSTASSSSSPEPSIQRWNYHVFLSFRGEDTRANFTAHLYAALKRAGIETFRDDDELKRGDAISDELLRAIEESLFAIVVLSENYADSSWCLDELQKILESRQGLDQTVFPVFYNVDPSDVRHQKGDYMESAFEKHKTKFSEAKMLSWRRALTDVANIAGWDTRRYKDEAEVIDEIVKAIWSKLRITLRPNFDNLVGIRSKVDKLISLLKIELECKCFVGIWGMGGIGKTTLARVVYDEIQGKFDHTCFLANVREKFISSSTYAGLVSLQEELLSCLLLRNIKIYNCYEGVKKIKNLLCNKKVLIVLDDVSHISQLKNLAGSKEWFGDGSKIIITTRDLHLLREYDESEEYHMETLERKKSFKLLCRATFKKDYPEEGFSELAWQVVDYAGGLPLALEVLGSYLRKKSQSQWKCALDDMKKNLSDDILKTLRISYDGLEDKLKKIFLDIACFFNWEEKVEVIKILERCGRSAENGIKDLIDKSLLKCHKPVMVEYFWQRSKEYLYMHDLLQEMGRNIVTQECSDDTSRQSRMWSQEQIDVVLKGNKGTRKVQGIYLNSQWQYKTEWHRDCFSSLQNVILLCLSNAHISHRLNSLPTALKVFIWERCPLEALPHNIDQLYELVDLRLRHSRIKLLWNGAPYLDKLKFIDLSHSEDLIEMPNVERIQNLESLLLEGCISLVRVHESLGQLKKLVKLNMKDCKNLVFLPTKLEMNSLEELILSGCSKLEKLPEFGEDMKSLSICDLSETKVKEIPSSIVKLTNIKELSLRGSKGLVSNSWGLSRLFWFMRRPISMGLRLPSFSGLSSLKKLDLSDCNLWDGSIPDDLSGLSSLMDLDLSGNNFSSLPAGCISNLTNLEYFYLSNCLRLQSMPHLPPNLLKVDATNCPSMETSLDLQNLFASLVAKHRHLLLYEDIVLQIPGDEIPSWFEQRECYINHFRSAVLITMNIPYVRDTREWSGIAVCLLLKNMISPPGRSHQIFWSFKDSEDDIHNDCRFGCWVKNSSVESKLYTAFFPFNSLNCWRHLSGGRSHLKLLIATFLPGRSTRWESAKGNMKIMDCGWRLICKKDFEAYGASNASSSLQITELHND